MSTEALHKLLSNAATVAAQVDTRLHYSHLPAGEFGPSIVIERGSDGRELLHRSSAGLVKGFALVNCFAPTYLGASDLGELVRVAIDGFTGTVAMAGGDVDYAFIQLEEVTDIPIDPPDARDQSPVPRRALDVRYAYHETAPNLSGA